MTTRDPSTRAAELAGTGVPKPFSLVYSREVEDCAKAEKAVHRILESHRTSPNREFFRLPIEAARQIVDAALDGSALLTSETLPTRALLEVRWATFFEHLELEYEFVRPHYEAQSADFVPSFFFPVQQCWLAVRSLGPAEEIALVGEFAKKQRQLVFFFGECAPLEMDGASVINSGHYLTPGGDWDGCMEFGVCSDCSSIQIGHFGSHDVTYGDDGFDTFHGCDNRSGNFTANGHLKEAYALASQISE